MSKFLSFDTVAGPRKRVRADHVSTIDEVDGAECFLTLLNGATFGVKERPSDVEARVNAALAIPA